MLKVSRPIHCVFAESKINIELGEGGSEINLLKMFPKIAKCPNNFGQDCSRKLPLVLVLRSMFKMVGFLSLDLPTV